jgi:hypothetical protein
MAFFLRALSVRVAIAFCVTLAASWSVARADSLADLGYAAGRLFHEDDRGVYYLIQEEGGGVTVPTVVALLKPDASGRFLRTTPVDVVTKRESGPGFAFSEDETKRVNDVLFPALVRLDPNRASDLTFHVLVHVFDRRFAAEWPGWPYPYEQPLMRVAWNRRTPTAPLRPDYEGVQQAGMFARQMIATLDQAVSARQPVASGAARVAAEQSASDAVAAAAAHSKELTERYETETEQRRVERIDAVQRRLAAAVSPGAVYRNHTFWGAFGEMDTARLIFEGSFDDVRDAQAAATYFMEFVEAVFARCEEFIPYPRAYYFNEWGREFTNGYRVVDGRFYVEMEPRFLEPFKAMVGIREGAELGGVLADLWTALTSGRREDSAAILFNTAAAIQEMLRRESQMNEFVVRAGCQSATVRQMGDNMLALAIGSPSVQALKSIPMAARETQPPLIEDAVWQEQIDTRRRLATPSEGPDGWPLHEARIAPYTNLNFADDTPYRTNPQYQKASSDIAATEQPVLTCDYGPTRWLDQGQTIPEVVRWNFWYAEKPAQLPELLSAHPDSEEFGVGIRFAVTACPETSAAAERLAPRP